MLKCSIIPPNERKGFRLLESRKSIWSIQIFARLFSVVDLCSLLNSVSKLLNFLTYDFEYVIINFSTLFQGLREMLEISHRNGSYSNPLLGPRLVSTSCQTDETSTQPDILTQEDDDYSAFNPILAVSPTSAASLSTASPTYSTSPRASSGGKNL